MNVEGFLGHFDAVKTAGDGKWTARCPAHDDRTPSLSIGLGEDDRILLICRAGCDHEAIVGALGLTVADLFADNGDWRENGSHQKPKKATKPPEGLPSETELAEWQKALLGNPAALDKARQLKGWSPGALRKLEVGAHAGRLRFPIRDTDGRLINLIGYAPRPEEGEPKSKALRGRPRGLFPAPESVESSEVWCLEGEGDTVSAATLGIEAVGIPGVNGWRAEYARRFAGLRVVVCTDCDDPGRKLAERVAADLTGAGVECRRVDLDPERSDGYDLGDHLLAAPSPDEAKESLLALAESASVCEPPIAKRPEGAYAQPLAEIRPERIKWLWPDRVPFGMLSMLAGDPGLGKSLLTIDLAAKVSRAAGEVLLLSAEDHAGATIRPRAMAANADLARIHIVAMSREGLDEGLRLPDDCDALDTLVEKHKARLVVIDPLMAHMADGVDSHSDKSSRTALAPLHHMAERRGCAVLFVLHLNKAKGADPMYRTGGSIAVPAAVRSALLLARDPDDPDGDRGSQRVLAHFKCNLGEFAESLTYSIGSVQLPGDEGLSAPRLMKIGTSETSGADLLNAGSGEERSERSEAIEILEKELADGPVRVKEVKAAVLAAGVSPRTLDRAKSSLRVTSDRKGFGAEGEWYWELPDRTPAHRTPPPTPPVASYEGNGSTEPSHRTPDSIGRHGLEEGTAA